MKNGFTKVSTYRSAQNLKEIIIIKGNWLIEGHAIIKRDVNLVPFNRALVYNFSKCRVGKNVKNFKGHFCGMQINSFSVTHKIIFTYLNISYCTRFFIILLAHIV